MVNEATTSPSSESNSYPSDVSANEIADSNQSTAGIESIAGQSKVGLLASARNSESVALQEPQITPQSPHSWNLFTSSRSHISCASPAASATLQRSTRPMAPDSLNNGGDAGGRSSIGGSPAHPARSNTATTGRAKRFMVRP